MFEMPGLFQAILAKELGKIGEKALAFLPEESVTAIIVWAPWELASPVRLPLRGFGGDSAGPILPNRG